MRCREETWKLVEGGWGKGEEYGNPIKEGKVRG